jgi:ubiquinone/menaquinone biosynthesis C-methylase UbiE
MTGRSIFPGAKPCRRGARNAPKFSGRRGHPVFARVYGLLAQLAERGELGRRRRELLARAEGTVVEVGTGTGENCKHYGPAVRRVLATEPDPAMLRQARKRAAAAPVPIFLVAASGEHLPFPGASADTAVVTLVLCSVDDQAAVVGELRRVLRPGGKVLFLEHVRAGDAALARWQDRLAGPWSRLAGGCRPNRRTRAALEAAGFELVDIEAYDLRPGIPLVRPHIQGVAEAPS